MHTHTATSSLARARERGDPSLPNVKRKKKAPRETLTLFLRYSLMARCAESVSLTNIRDLRSSKLPCDDKPYWTSGTSAISSSPISPCVRLLTVSLARPRPSRSYPRTTHVPLAQNTADVLRSSVRSSANAVKQRARARRQRTSLSLSLSLYPCRHSRVSVPASFFFFRASLLTAVEAHASLRAARTWRRTAQHGANTADDTDDG